MNNHTEQILEFHQIKKQLLELANTEGAKAKIQELKPYLSELEVKAQMRDTTEAKQMIEKCGNPPSTAMKDIHQLMQAAAKGICLTAEELEGVAVMLTAVKRLKDYLNRCKQFDMGLAYYEENLESLEEIREQIDLKIRNGAVEDSASKELRGIRQEIEHNDLQMRSKAEIVMRAHKDCMSDSFYTTRSGHICVPVKKECRQKVAGTVIDKSATGNTLFVESESVEKYYQILQECRIDEENEVQRILYELTAMLSAQEEIVRKNSQTVEKLDFIFAKAKLSIAWNGVEPHLNTERYIQIADGRHPLMNPEETVPLNFTIGKNGIRGVIITGPNTGGKTVAIKTVALNCYMAQCGLHVSCRQADICLNDMILCDIGDGQNLSENLSTFSAQITNVLDILRHADGESLVIMDELGSGTDPTEGMGIAIAVLQELKKSGALYLVTTHYPEVKNYARDTEGVINARMAFDRESLQPLYQLVIGEAGESCALHIAKRLGMPEAMLQCAKQAAYGVSETQSKSAAAYDTAASRVSSSRTLQHVASPHLKKQKMTGNKEALSEKFRLGDSVMIYPEAKIGIVCEPVNEKGILRVQMPDRKIWINHKRVKLHVAASQLYPPDYDFSIIFDTVENRKLRHDMGRKFVEHAQVHIEE